jgi:glycosyltransferase involved in cell wall biosynthesis
MKVLIIGSGSSTHLVKWVNGLLEKGCTIILFSLNDFDRKQFNQSVQLSCYHFGYSKNAGLEGKALFSKMNYLRAVPEIKKLIKKHQPDILHAHYASSYGLIGSYLNFHPYIVSVWGSDVYDFPNKNFVTKKMLKRVFSKADTILSTSSAMADEVKKYTSKKIIETPFGVDVEHFKPTVEKNEDNEIIIGTVKTLLPIYGIDTLIEAFAMVVNMNPKLNLKLEIAGSGTELSSLEALVTEKGLDNKVRFLGYVNHAEVPDCLNRFDLFVALSRQESFGVAVVEAMACQLPVVVSDAAGLKEVVENNEFGYVVPTENPKEAAKKINELIKNEELRIKFGQKARVHVLSHYDWKKNLNQMWDIYNNTIHSKH